MNTQILTIVSGIACVLSSTFMLYILYVNFENKQHKLRMFQLAMFAVLFVIGIVQILSFVTLKLADDQYLNVSDSSPLVFDNFRSLSFLALAVLIIPYFVYYKRKKKSLSH